MHIEEKLASLSPKETVAQLSLMLPAHVAAGEVTIDSRGRRMVAFDGYEGCVEINTLASVYLKAEPFQWDSKASLQERLECYSLWKRVNQLYVDSDAALAKTRLFRYLTPLTEARPYCRACAGDPMAIIRSEDAEHRMRQSVFRFRPPEFKYIWPREKPIYQEEDPSQGIINRKWWASKQMVKQAVAQPNPLPVMILQVLKKSWLSAPLLLKK